MLVLERDVRLMLQNRWTWSIVCCVVLATSGFQMLLRFVSTPIDNLVAYPTARTLQNRMETLRYEEEFYAGSLFPLGLDTRRWIPAPLCSAPTHVDDFSLHVERGGVGYEFTLRGLHPCDGSCSISGGMLIVNGTVSTGKDEERYCGEIPFIYLGAPGDGGCKIMRTPNPVPDELMVPWVADQRDRSFLVPYSAEDIIRGKDLLRDLLWRVYRGDDAAKRQLITRLMDFYVRQFASH